MALWRVRATVDDRPGFLAVLTASLALRSVNILSVQVHGAQDGAVDDFLVEAPDELSEDELLAAVVRGRGRDPWVRQTETPDLVDPPTELLAAAVRVARDPGELDAALANVLLGAMVRRIPGGRPSSHWSADDPDGDGFTPNRLQIEDPGDGILFIERFQPPFTPAEYARARALVEVASEVRRNAGARWALALADGGEVAIRPITNADRTAVRDMYARCSAASRRSRFLGGRTTVPWSGSTLVATGDDTIRAVGTAYFDGPDARVAILVEDGWQRRGVGTALLRRLIVIASSMGAVVVHAYAGGDGTVANRTMQRLGVDPRRFVDGPMATISVDLRGRVETLGPPGESTTLSPPLVPPIRGDLRT